MDIMDIVYYRSRSLPARQRNAGNVALWDAGSFLSVKSAFSSSEETFCAGAGHAIILPGAPRSTHRARAVQIRHHLSTIWRTPAPPSDPHTVGQTALLSPAITRWQEGNA